MPDITNEKIYQELQELKRMVQLSLDLQRQIASMEEDIKLFEGKQMEEEQRIANAVKQKKFSSIFEWKKIIWDDCPQKVEHVTQETVSFHCKVLKGPCMFETCPRNFIEIDDYKTSQLP